MAVTGTTAMCIGELARLKVIQAVLDGTLKPGQAAWRLQLTTRQIRRRVGRYQAQGAAGPVLGKRDHPTDDHRPHGSVARVMTLIRQPHADFARVLARERFHDYRVSPD